MRLSGLFHIAFFNYAFLMRTLVEDGRLSPAGSGGGGANVTLTPLRFKKSIA